MLVGFNAQNHPQQTAARGALDEVDDRGTEPEFVRGLEDRFGAPFTLDVAAAAHNTKAPRFYDRATDGLKQSWAGERVWCNPPYSGLGDWLAKAWSEWPDTRGIVMLLPANRVEQSWWQDHVEPFRDREGSPLKVEFLRGRMRFIRPNAVISPKGDRPPFGCALLVWREPLVRERPKPSRAPRGRNVLTWTSNDTAVAPDGAIYALNAESIRGEGRQWWAEIKGQEVSHPTDAWATSKRQAREAAEHHARIHHSSSGSTGPGYDSTTDISGT